MHPNANFARLTFWLLVTLPSDAEKKGDFSQAKNVSGGLLTIYDPWTTKTAADGTASRTPFAGNLIPSNRIDPAGQVVMNDLWAPNNAGDSALGTNNFKTNYGVLTHYWNFSDRADYYIPLQPVRHAHRSEPDRQFSRRPQR